MNELTASQKTALARDKNISVTAGAGTGKTRILIERYIDILLQENIDIKEILAITFTNKAAAEMMDRTAEILKERLKNTHDIEIRAKLSNCRNRLSSAYISTIHSFCTKILREYPVEAGLDPDFGQLNELQTELLIEETISEELEQINNEEDTWLELFRLFGLNTIKDMLRFALAHRYEMYSICAYYSRHSIDHVFAALSRSYLDIVKSAFNQSLLQQISAIVNQILKTDLKGTIQYEKASAIVTLLQQFQNQQPEHSEYWHQLFKLAVKFTTQKNTAYNNLGHIGSEEAWNKDLREQLLSLSEILTPIARWQRKNSLTPPAELDRYVIAQAKIFYNLYKRVEKRFNDKKREEVVVDFDDLQMVTLDLLNDNEHICKKITNQFKYIMVDEFQDTNLLQWKIISLLGQLHDGKFFVVGDPKQSIYGFRNADVRVFNDVKNQFSGQDKRGTIILEDNFRFKDSINHFVNFVFDKIMCEENGNPWEVGYHSLAVKRDDSGGGEIEFALIDDHNDDKFSQAEFIANRINGLRSQTQFKYGDMAILLRTRNHLNEIEEQLRRNNIPFKTVGGTGFYQKQEIFDLYHLIRFIIHPEDDLALIGILRSPFANISDEGLFFLARANEKANYWQRVLDCEKLNNLPKSDLRNLRRFRAMAEQWIRRRERVGFTELLNEILYDSTYRSILSASLKGEQLLANINKILELCNEYEKNSLISLTDFAESLRLLINKQSREGEAQTDLEDESTVKVMTIHKAKGLEFPLVFVPYLEQKLNTPNSRSVYMDEQLGLAAVLQNKGVPVEIPTEESYALLDFLRFNQKKKDIAELKRLFYVGCTRAKDHLILTAKMKDHTIPPDTPLSWLIQSLDIKTDELKAGRWKYENDNDIRVWRSYDRYDDQAMQIRLIKNSVKKLRKLMTKGTEQKKKPLFLLPTEDQPKGEIFSATQILTFIKDKEEYFRRYNLGFFEGDYDRLLLTDSEEDKALLKGKLLHKYFETYPNFNLENTLFELEVSDGLLIADLAKELTQITRKMKDSPVLKRIFSAHEYQNEARIMMRLDSDFLTGTLDRIFKNEDTQWEVIDYKTNRINSNQVKQTALQYTIQMDIYAILLSHLYPSQEVIPVSLYFTQPDQMFQIKYSQAELKQIDQRIFNTVEEIKKYPPYLI